jgi:hypothetical protein
LETGCGSVRNFKEGAKMAKVKLTSEEIARIEDLAKSWGKIVVRRHWGEQGPGLDVDLNEMEEVAMVAVRALLAGTLETATLQQADQLGPEQACPECGRMCSLQRDPRPIVARTGSSFDHNEPKAHCPACRRDFFPSAPDPETDNARVQPVDSEQDRAGDGPSEVASRRGRGSRRRR